MLFIIFPVLLRLVSCFNVLQLNHYAINHTSMLRDIKSAQIQIIQIQNIHIGWEGCELIANAGVYPQLVALSIVHCHLTPKAIKALTKLQAPNLVLLSLMKNPIRDEGFELLMKLPWVERLEGLVLQDCGITGQAMQHITNKKFVEMELLNLAENLLGEVGYKHLTNATFPALKLLHIGRTDLEKGGIVHFKKWNLTGLRQLSVPRMNFTPAEFDGLAQMQWPQLLTLEIYGIPLQPGPLMHFVNIKLPKLTSLNMMETKLDSQHAQHLANIEMPNLMVIDLSSNQLTSQDIKSIVGNKPNLQQLLVQENLIDDLAAAVEVLPNVITSFNFAGNLILANGKQLISHFSRFSNLVYLSLGDNGLEDEDVAAILAARDYKFVVLMLYQLPLREKTFQALSRLDLSQLTVLELSHSPFWDRITAMNKTMQLPALTALDFNNTRLGKEGIAYISQQWKMDNLDTLVLESCHINDETLAMLSKMNMSKLSRLLLGSSLQSNFSGKGFSAFGVDQLQSLSQLSLDNNNLTLEGLRELSKLRLPNLRTLSLINCGLTDQTAIYLIENIHMPNLVSLKLDSNWLIGDGTASAIATKVFRNLIDLGLSWTYVSNKGFKLIANYIPWLKQLSLAGINITSTALEGCRPELFANLEALNISNNRLGNKFFQSLVELQPNQRNMREMVVTQNDLKEGIGAIIAKLKFPVLTKIAITKGNNLTQQDIDQINAAVEVSGKEN